MALAGQPSSTGQAPATTLARHGHLRRHDLSLERRCELLRLIEPEPEFSQADRLAALTRMSELDVGRLAAVLSTALGGTAIVATRFLAGAADPISGSSP